MGPLATIGEMVTQHQAAGISDYVKKKCFLFR